MSQNDDPDIQTSAQNFFEFSSIPRAKILNFLVKMRIKLAEFLKLDFANWPGLMSVNILVSTDRVGSAVKRAI